MPTVRLWRLQKVAPCSASARPRQRRREEKPVSDEDRQSSFLHRLTSLAATDRVAARSCRRSQDQPFQRRELKHQAAHGKLCCRATRHLPIPRRGRCLNQPAIFGRATPSRRTGSPNLRGSIRRSQSLPHRAAKAPRNCPLRRRRGSRISLRGGWRRTRRRLGRVAFCPCARSRSRSRQVLPVLRRRPRSKVPPGRVPPRMVSVRPKTSPERSPSHAGKPRSRTLAHLLLNRSNR